MKEEILWELVARQLSGEQEAKEELSQLRKQDPALDKLVRETMFIWEKSEKLGRPSLLKSAAEVDVEIEKMSARIAEIEAVDTVRPASKTVQMPPHKANYPFMKVAAAAAVFLVAFLAWWNFSGYPDMMSSDLEKVVTISGEKKSVQLPDGTVVHLNVSSELQYPAAFIGTERKVALKGEAFFEVQADAQKPFVVETSRTRTEVLGTAFNLRAYPNDQLEKLAVKHGKVRFQEKAIQKSIVLEKGNGAIYDAKSQAIAQVGVDPEDVAAWRQGTLSFQNVPFAAVIADLERWYGVEIELTNQALLEKGFTGRFEDKQLEEVLQSLTKALGVSYQKASSKKIVIE